MSQLLCTLYPSRFVPDFRVLGKFTHKAIPLDPIGKKIVKGSVETKAINVERAAKLIADGEDSIVGLAEAMGVSVASANAYISALEKAGRVRKERSSRANGVRVTINGA